MTTSSLYADVHPIDILERAKGKLGLVNTLLCNNPEAEGTSDSAKDAGIYWLIDSICCELELAMHKLMEG